MIAASFPSLLQRFFTERLLQHRQVSPHTIASYRDTFRLLLRFAADRLHRAPSAMKIEDWHPAFLGTFLEHLEQTRGNSTRTRNSRLAALHSFFRYVALTEPAHALLCQQVLAMPSKRYSRKPIAFLDRTEIAALLASPDPSTWIGRRDRTLLAVAIQTGLRVSELIRLRRTDVALGTGAHVRCEGRWNRGKINVSTVFAGQDVGVRQVSDRIWLVSFMDYDLGYFDDETCRLEPIDNPFKPKVLPMSPE